MWFKCNLLLLCGDGELNPGLKQDTEKKYIWHWNLKDTINPYYCFLKKSND